MQELERQETVQVVRAFAQRMHTMRDYLARSNRLTYPLQKKRWFLDAAGVYCEAVSSFYRELLAIDLKSRGFLAFREYLKEYADSERFLSLVRETQRLKADIAAIDYRIHIKGKDFTVRKSESEVDFSAAVEKIFERFKQGSDRDYRATFPEPVEMDELEATILGAVAQLYPDVFDALDAFCERNADFTDETITAFDREVQFYIGYLDFKNTISAAGLQFCYPALSETSKEIYQVEGFDLALANKLVAEEKQIVCNDFYMRGKERIFVISGPNQGGKTTFARAFGQSHYLAALGCPVPGKEARLFLFDNIFTHFEKEENVEDLRSKLEDDLLRIRNILGKATSRSIFIANEILTSTTLDDAIFLGKKVMDSISRLDLLCVWVTFVEELTSYCDKAVSMVSMVDPEDPSRHTFKIMRRPPHGLSYATALVEKYSLTYESLRERIK
jgi:DNA mismatch repair ATPase MutS